MAQKELWNVAEKRMLEDTGAFLKEDGNQLMEHNATHGKKNFLNEDAEEGKAEMERLSEEAKQQESENGEREVRRETVEGSRQAVKESVWIVWIILMWVGEFSRPLVAVLRWRMLGLLWVFLVCACFASCCVMVTVPYSDANLVRELVFSVSDCEFIELQTYSPTRKREANVALECETEMN